jgi:hypothetical protein
MTSIHCAVATSRASTAGTARPRGTRRRPPSARRRRCRPCDARRGPAASNQKSRVSGTPSLRVSRYSTVRSSFVSGSERRRAGSDRARRGQPNGVDLGPVAGVAVRGGPAEVPVESAHDAEWSADPEVAVEIDHTRARSGALRSSRRSTPGVDCATGSPCPTCSARREGPRRSSLLRGSSRSRAGSGPGPGTGSDADRLQHAANPARRGAVADVQRGDVVAGEVGRNVRGELVAVELDVAVYARCKTVVQVPRLGFEQVKGFDRPLPLGARR